MDTLKGELASFETLKDIKSLLASEGPCLSVYMPLSKAGVNPNVKQDALRWQECLRNAEEKIKPHGKKGRELLEAISSWDAVVQGQEPQGKSIAVFRARDTFQVIWLQQEVVDRAVVGPHFYIRPLLPALTRDNTFYVLALSQKDIRLLRCTSRTSDDVPFPAGTVTSFEHWMNTAEPDHTNENRGEVVASKDKDQFLSHFFKQIDRGLSEVLRGHTEPLVLAGVDYELTLYRELNRYPHLAKESVQGAPNSLKAGEMHARALEALDRCYKTQVDDALTEWNHKVGGGASSRLKDVIKAAHDGRVLTLLVSDSLEKTGVFDEDTHVVKGRKTGTVEDEDLVNDAAVQTILHAGKVLVAPHHKMPNGAALAAIFRF